MTQIILKNLTKNFGAVKAVDGITLSFPLGKIIGLIGPNGSGKTTLINIMSGILKQDSGTIILSGEILNNSKKYYINKHGIVRTFQNIELFEQLTVKENIQVVLSKKNVVGSLFEKQNKKFDYELDEILTRTGLIKLRHKRAVDLSYGQRKLLEISRALATKASIYLFDEPFSGLFSDTKKLISKIIKNLNKEGKTILLIEHNIELIKNLTDYLFVLDNGKLLAAGKPNDVLNKKTVIQAYLGK